VLQRAVAVVPPVPHPVSPSHIVPQRGASSSCRGMWRGMVWCGVWRCGAVRGGAWCAAAWRGAARGFRPLNVLCCVVVQYVAGHGVVHAWQGMAWGGVQFSAA